MAKFNFNKLASKQLSIISILIFGLLLSSCEEKINLEVDGRNTQLLVDAFLVNDPGKQTIKLRRTTDYFNNDGLPPANGATVKITDMMGNKYYFHETDKTGAYVYNPDTNAIPLGIPGTVYFLEIAYNNQIFTSSSFMDFVPSIDSLFAEKQPALQAGPNTIPEGYTLNMFAKDLPGEGNCYWFKSYRNNVLFDKPGQINIAYDGAYGPGSDGVQFIPPIIFGLSPERFIQNDSALVECYSIGMPTYYFLLQSRTQMTNGGLFASPTVNAPTNIYNSNKESKAIAVGWFTMASVTRKGIKIK